MLRLRICPSCQEEIRSPKAYFCYRCGEELPSPPDQPPAGGGSEADRGKTEPVETRLIASLPKKRIPTAIVAATLVVAVFVGVGVYYFRMNFSTLPAGRQASLPSALKNETFVANTTFAVENHPFSAKGLSEIVPADVDLYLESISPEVLLPSLVSEEDWEKAQSFFDNEVGLSPTEAASFLEDEFALVQESTASAFLVRVKDVDFVEQKIAEVGGYNGWQARMVNGFLVVFDSQKLIRSVEEAQKKLTLNLSLTSGFAEARNKLPKTGQIFYYGKKRLEFMPDSVKGEAFVVSKKDDGIFITGL